MIPSGICVDLETTIAGKIPDSVRPSGQKRFETRIIEIGAVHWQQQDKRFMRLVNPIDVKLQSGHELIQHLKSIHQKPGPTLNFWSRVLVRRNSVDRTMFEKEESPEVWLARNLETRANDFVRWFNGAHGPAFVPEKEALYDLLEWSGNESWLAHNGNSFDFKVLQGCALRTGIAITPAIQQYDTLKLFRKQLPGHKSYSQPILYEKLFGEKYNAHVAIDDALALSRLCHHCHSNGSSQSSKAISKSSKAISKSSKAISQSSKGISQSSKGSSQSSKGSSQSSKIPTVKKSMDLTFKLRASVTVATVPTFLPPRKSIHKIRDLAGVGPKSVAAFRAENVNTIEQLFKRYKDGGQPWLKELLPFGVHWRKVERSIQTAVK